MIMSFLIPEELETERLILRIFRLDDLSDIHEYYADPECTKYTSRRPLKKTKAGKKWQLSLDTGDCIIMVLMQWKRKI
jgi:RimJ/RimL family protein N-acetyltransferase